MRKLRRVTAWRKLLRAIAWLLEHVYAKSVDLNRGDPGTKPKPAAEVGVKISF